MERNKKSPLKSSLPGGVETFHSKVQPHSIEAEISVLGGITIENNALNKVMEIISPDDFYVSAHRIIYEAILGLGKENQPIDILTVGEFLKARGLLESVGGFEYLSKIQDEVPTIANIDAHARVIREKASVRACINASMEVLSRGYGEYGNVEDFLDEAEKKIFDATHKKSISKVISMKEAVKSTFKQIDVLSRDKSSITGVPTGFKDLDRVTYGLQNSDLVIIAGRPSMGKTAFALNIALNAWRDKKVPSLIFSLEMSIYQLMLRVLSVSSSVQASRLKAPGYLSTAEFSDLTTAAGWLEKMTIFLDDSPELNVMDIRSRARRLKDEHDIGLIVVDYLQILKPAFSSKQENREREVAEMSRSLKALAKELNIPVVALSQLNRRPEQREKNKRPQLADLRESGAIEQDADLIMFLYRESIYKRDEELARSKERPGEPEKAEVIIGKNRNGPTCSIDLYFAEDFTRFEDPKGDQVASDEETSVGGINNLGFD